MGQKKKKKTQVCSVVRLLHSCVLVDDCMDMQMTAKAVDYWLNIVSAFHLGLIS